MATSRASRNGTWRGFAETLLPLLATRPSRRWRVAKEALAAFAPRFEAGLIAGMRRKLGLATEQEGDAALAQDLLTPWPRATPTSP